MKIVINRCFGGFSIAASVAEALDIDDRTDERHNPALVAAVERDAKAASGYCAELCVVEVPDGLEYEVTEYDGMEGVVTSLAVTPEELAAGLSPERVELAKIADCIKLRVAAPDAKPLVAQEEPQKASTPESYMTDGPWHYSPLR